MTYDPTRGRFDDLMPTGGVPRSAMGQLECNIPYRLTAVPKGWRLAKTGWTPWVLTDTALWDRLNAARVAGSLRGPVTTPGRDKDFYDLFIAAAGDFDVYSALLGTPPSRFNNLAPRPEIPFPYPTGQTMPGKFFQFGIRYGINFNIYNTSSTSSGLKETGTNSNKPFLLSMPILVDIINLV
jgi:hypothetical protein